MKKLPISIQTFEKIRVDDYLYVDKTDYLYELITHGKYYFLARPRRFGKSLLLSTLKSYFKGQSTLFEGLYIAEKETAWKSYPVVHIDYSFVEYKKGRTTFEYSLLKYLETIAASFGLKIEEKVIVNYFAQLISALHEQHGKVVVLVDEYDKPLVDVLTDQAQFYENREVLKSFYGVLKGLDDCFRFVMLTGVSRFAKVNVFSGLNNLNDISMNARLSGIVGFTQAELEHHFEPYIQSVQEELNLDRPSILQTIKSQYNGYSWDGKTFLYNPFSIIKFSIDRRFRNYWFSTGTPTFLIKLLKVQKTLPENLEVLKTTDLEGSSMQIENLPLIPILFQTGYLTVKKIEFDGVFERFFIGYPNEEVRHAFITYIAAAFMGKDEFEIPPEALKLRDALREDRPDDFIRYLQSFLADIPARLHIAKEAYYHSLVYMMLRLVGMKTLLEKETDKGRIDAVLELPDKIYIIEFKFAQNKRLKNVETLSKNALKQIEQKQYHEAYLSSGKRIILFGIGFLDKQLHGRVKEL